MVFYKQNNLRYLCFTKHRFQSMTRYKRTKKKNNNTTSDKHQCRQKCMLSGQAAYKPKTKI